MKLSEMLETFNVVADNHFEFVLYHMDEMDDIEKIDIEWNNIDELGSYFYEFLDQDIVLTENVGQFKVTSIDGKEVLFSAYKLATLE